MPEEINTTTKIIKAASACVWRANEVLLVRRGKELGRGLWALPGGRLEPGETAIVAAAREMTEETGVVAELGELIGIYNIATPRGHFEISCFMGHWLSGEARAGDDADAVQWVSVDNINNLPLAPNVANAIKTAHNLIRL